MTRSNNRRIRLQDCCKALDINVTTLWRWIKKAKIDTQKDDVDRRVQTISLAELARLSHDHERPLLGIVDDKAMQDDSKFDNVNLASLQSCIASLAKLIDELSSIVEFFKAHQPTVKTAEFERKVSPMQELPGELVIAKTFAEAHSIPESTMRRHVNNGTLHVTEGSYHTGSTIAKWAFNKQQRSEFYQWAHTRDGFKKCDDCPH